MPRDIAYNKGRRFCTEGVDQTVAVPTLVLHGEADARSPLANAEALHATIPESELVVLPKLGHACVAEDPEACATAIRHFVKNMG